MKIDLKKINDKIVRDYVTLRKDHKERQNSGLVMLTDPKTCHEYPGVIPQLLVSQGFTGILPDHDQKITTTDEVLRKISGMKNHAHLVAIVNKPESKMPANLGRILFLDQIQNPGNLGTIIRNALAFSFDALFLSPNCCDPFNDKCIRAAKSALFHLPIFKMKMDDFVQKYDDFTFYMADTQGKELFDIDIRQKSALILSNEGSGPSKALQCQKITIKMNEKVESLNVACASGILMHAFSRASCVEKSL
jgi:RNA methyltransferase, TrmH family